MTAHTLSLILLAAAIPASLAAQGGSQKSVQIDQVKMLGTGDGPVQVVMNFEQHAVSIRSANDADPEVLKRVRYEDIQSAEQRGRSLTIRCGTGTTVLRLRKADRKRVRRELARRSGVAVERPYVPRGSFDWPGQI